MRARPKRRRWLLDGRRASIFYLDGGDVILSVWDEAEERGPTQFRLNPSERRELIELLETEAA